MEQDRQAITLTQRQRDAAIAGLRLLQEAILADRVEPRILAIAEDHGDGLDVDGIDELCATING